ncbi:head GIN domain-containing protein [Cupriavidus sp. CV2]|uniref:head GIN domain-containing protein n=1 Tax=Cupriavidus ulmosensis TaxID=3065913 RepID=UPI00296B4A23|nr:head GIN domain-containing protein [Cupriavidus sp. CV2]MDW3680618.1 head GIN domain-containing protein [Cupriavidus sp. CV2]
MTRINLLRATWVASGCLASAALAQQSTVVINQSGISASGASGSSVVIVNGQVVTSHDATKGSGPEKTEQRLVGAFSSVQLNAPVDAVFSASRTHSVSITGPEDVLPLVLTTLADGKLTIGLSAPVVLAAPLRVAITGPSLQAVSIPGAGTLRASGLHEASIDLRLSGSGSIVAEGTVGSLRAAISGSGEVDASALRAQRLDAQLSGSGRILGYASDAASVALTGSGDIVVAGKPHQRAVSRTGSGQVSFE